MVNVVTPLTFQLPIFWLNKGVDGFRMDATSHFYGLNEHFGLDNHQENLDFLTEYNDFLLTVDPDVYVVVEAWESYQTYAEYFGTGVSAFNFQANYYIKDVVRGFLSEDIGDALNRVYNYIIIFQKIYWLKNINYINFYKSL